MLHMLLTVVDNEDVIVLHVPEKKGFKIKIGGISDNFQVQFSLCFSFLRWILCSFSCCWQID